MNDRGHVNHVPKNDVPWIRRFAAAGGKVIISGNTQMRVVPHERVALVETGMIVIFFESQWSRWPFCTKCAHLLHWWPVISAALKEAQAASFFHVPSTWDLSKGLRTVPNHDQKLVKIARQKEAQPRVAAARRSRRSLASQGDLGI